MSRLKMFAILLVLMLSLTGCSTKDTKDTKVPVSSNIGIIDMDKAIKAHPKYNELIEMQKQYNAMVAEAEAKQQASQDKANASLPTELPSSNSVEVNKYNEQQTNNKKAAKQNELEAQLAAKEASVRESLNGELQAYSAELDKIYQPQIFNLQLKLKTVQFTKEQNEETQTELNKLQSERADKLAAKTQTLQARLNEIMAPERKAAQQQLLAYTNQLEQENSQQAQTKPAEINTTNTSLQEATPLPENAAQNDTKEQDLVMKKQDIEALEGFIIQNTKDKAGKVAVEKGLEAVFTGITVNVTGIDITDDVIAEFNK